MTFKQYLFRGIQNKFVDLYSQCPWNTIFYWSFILSMCKTRSQNAETSGCECKVCQSCEIGWQVPRCLAQDS